MATKPFLLQNAIGIGLPAEDKVANILNGAQLGVGYNAEMLDAATPLVFTPSVLVVMKTPSMYNGNQSMRQMIKTLVECHAKSVTGIDFGYTVDTEDGPIGHDGQTFKVPTQTRRSEVTPSFTFNELTGNLVYNVFKQWVWDIQHPDTNISISSPQAAFNGPRIAQAYSMTIMAIQFDPTGKPENIVDAALYTNMFPTDIGQIGFERTIGTTRVIERTVTFTGYVQHNYLTKLIAKELAQVLQLHKVDFTKRALRATEIDGNLSNSGLNLEIQEAMASTTP